MILLFFYCSEWPQTTGWMRIQCFTFVTNGLSGWVGLPKEDILNVKSQSPFILRQCTCVEVCNYMPFALMILLPIWDNHKFTIIHFVNAFWKKTADFKWVNYKGPERMAPALILICIVNNQYLKCEEKKRSV